MNVRNLAALMGMGSAIVVTFPALAQTPNNNVLNQNPTILNETPYNRSGQVNDQCAYIQGGIGGPVDSTSYAPRSNSPTFTRQFDVNNPSSAVAFRSNGPAGTSGKEASMNLDANRDIANRRLQASAPGTISLDRAEIRRREFDANNPTAALPFRANGPAATSGRGASTALDNSPERDRSDNLGAIPSVSSNATSAAQPTLGAAPIPTECAPR
jgi:hypothetical protein